MDARGPHRRASTFAAPLGVLALVWAASCTSILGDFGAPDVGSASGGGGSTTTAASTSSHHGSSSTSSGPGGGGAGGAGGAGGCDHTSECPAPQVPCRQRTCTGNVCGFATVKNAPSPYQVPGDCQTLTCDSSGDPVATIDGSDDDDLNACTSDHCVGHMQQMPIHDPRTGQPCDFDGGKFCNNLAQCVECATYQNCPTLGACDPDTYTCQPPTCTDTIKNQDETAADCGGATCTTRCALAQACVDPADCASGLTCSASVCKLLVGGMCVANADCASNVCQTGICRIATCANAVKDGSESAVDCGGTACKKCVLGQTCNTNADCASGTCNTAVSPATCL